QAEAACRQRAEIWSHARGKRLGEVIGRGSVEAYDHERPPRPPVLTVVHADYDGGRLADCAICHIARRRYASAVLYSATSLLQARSASGLLKTGFPSCIGISVTH